MADFGGPSVVRRSAFIEEGRTCFRQWDLDERLFIAVADASNFQGAQAILNVALRGMPMADLRANHALLARFGISQAQASRRTDEALMPAEEGVTVKAIAVLILVG